MGLPGVMIPHIRSGKLRAIATTGSSRSEFLPEVPTLKESGYDFVDYARFGLFAPKGVPQPVQQKLAAALEEAVKSPEFAALMQKSFTSVLYHSPAEYRSVLDEENRRWAALLNNPKFAEAMK
jgi:tripartite-type tricarboxylate transporter receptor subunit TctC